MTGKHPYSRILQKLYEDIVVEYHDPEQEENNNKLDDFCSLIREANKNLESEIHRRKQAEDTLHRSEEHFSEEVSLYTKKIRAMEMMTGNIAHHFNNLLMSIQGNILLMLKKTEPAHESYPRLKNIELSVHQGVKLTQQLLDIAGGAIIDAVQTDPPLELEPERKSSLDEGLHTETVLLVDDEQMVRDVASEMLQAIGCKVIVARNGAEAVALYKEEMYGIDLVVLDMIMPQMSGSETFDRLKKINPGVRVLLSSGYSLDGQANFILDRGCSGFIQKPYDMDMLSHKIREITTCPASGST